MTEADTESIWDTLLDTTRFGKIGVRIAELLNIWVNDGATKQITNVDVTPLLEQISEEILFDLMSSAQLEKVTNPWDFVQARVVRVAARILENYGDTWLEKVKTILGRNKVIEIVRRTL